MPRGGLEVAAAAFGGLVGIGGLGFFEFGHRRAAQAAADGFQVELDVLLQRFVEDAELVAAERLAVGAGQAITPSDFATASPLCAR